LEHYWYKNIVVYGIDVKSFFDSDGDGVGDFKGLIQKIDYIHYLGVNCIWLLPFYPSPLRDNGYDITDYYQVDSRLGTLEDFQNFVIKAGERGIRVIIDIVMNHTSNEHPWFLAAKNDPQSVFKDYYVWSKIPPPHEGNDFPAFPETEPSLWQFEPKANGYYYHKFYHFQPDLKVSNPRVQEEIHKVIDFWFSFGIAGIRLDAVPVMIHRKGLDSTMPPSPKEIFCQLRDGVTSKRPDAILLGEVDVDGDQIVHYFADGDGLHLVFNFILNAYIMGALASRESDILIKGWRELPVIPESGGWLNFLRNLDELNINQLPIDVREKVYREFSPDIRMKIYNRGIRRRLASMLDGDPKRILMSMSLLLSLPGTPLICYGDELGMGDNLHLWEREAVRTPMQWSEEVNGGFSSTQGPLFRDMVQDEKFSFRKINVTHQARHSDSLLNKTRELIKIRISHHEIGFGRIEWVEVTNKKVLAHICHWKNEMLLALHYLSDSKDRFEIDLKTIHPKELIKIVGDIDLTRKRESVFEGDLQQFNYGWFKIHLSRGQ